MEDVDFSPPRLLAAEDDLDGFDCGSEPLNSWLRLRAQSNHVSGASRSYVCASGARVIGYFCLAAGSVQHEAAPGSIRRNMPDPVPTIIMGRLAVDLKVRGRGIGRQLVIYAIERCEEVAEIAGFRALLVHAKDTVAAAFYSRHKFIASPIDPLMLMIRIG